MFELSTDIIILTFVKNFLSNNLIAITAILWILKSIAKATPWAIDDEIIQIVTGLISKLAPGFNKATNISDNILKTKEK